jgi:hypothetical protein
MALLADTSPTSAGFDKSLAPMLFVKMMAVLHHMLERASHEGVLSPLGYVSSGRMSILFDGMVTFYKNDKFWY